MPVSKLQKVQNELNNRQIKNIHIHFVPELKSIPLADAKELVASVLWHCMNQKGDIFPGVGDRHLVTQD